MKILKRLKALSVEDLRLLQVAILDEIQRRKELLGIAATAAGRSVIGHNFRKEARAAPASKPAPAAARPAKQRRAA
jgi:hypothetical protein